MIKKILSTKKSPIRLIYEGLYGTTIGPRDEVSYIVSCLRETLNIVGSHYIKKILPGKK
jgi:hypothetical protein